MLSDEEIEDCISEARKSLRRHRSAIRGQMCVPADQLDWHVARAVERAAYERAAQECELQITGSDYHFLVAHGHWDHMAQAATNCAAAIRKLGRQ